MIKHDDDANRCRIQCSYEIVNKVDRTIIKTIKIFDASNASTVRVGLPAETTVLQKVCLRCSCIYCLQFAFLQTIILDYLISQTFFFSLIIISC